MLKCCVSKQYVSMFSLSMIFQSSTGPKYTELPVLLLTVHSMYQKSLLLSHNIGHLYGGKSGMQECVSGSSSTVGLFGTNTGMN